MIVNVIIIMQKDDTMLFCHGEEGAKKTKAAKTTATAPVWSSGPMTQCLNDALYVTKQPRDCLHSNHQPSNQKLSHIFSLVLSKSHNII